MSTVLYDEWCGGVRLQYDDVVQYSGKRQKVKSDLFCCFYFFFWDRKKGGAIIN
jgi:hypothetical protein